MVSQAQNLPQSHVSDSVTGVASETTNSFQVIHRYLHYQMLHMYLQFKLQQMQQQRSSPDAESSDDADEGFFESDTYQIALSDQLSNLGVVEKYFPKPILPLDSGSSVCAYELIVLDHSNPDSYHNLLPSRFHSYLGTLAFRLPKLILVGVQLQSQPVGFISAISSPDRTRANILSLFVEPAHRQRGLGKQLLTRMEQVLRDHGCQQVDLTYSSDTTTPDLEYILGQHNWLPARPYSLICSTHAKNFEKAPWMYRHPLPASFTTFPWLELTAEQRQEIQAQRQESLKYPPELDPFKEEDKIDPVTSLGLCYQGQVLGWMITHRIAPDTLRYSALFVKQDLPKIRCAVPLIATAIKRQIENAEVTKLTFVVMAYNTPMIRFLQRHLAPYLTSIDRTWTTTKLFTKYQL